MRVGKRFGWMLFVATFMFLSACGGSGGGGEATRDGTSCQGSACAAPDDSTEDDAPAAPLTCNDADGAGCPEGYRCVSDQASCDPDNATGCDGLCVLGEELPHCGTLGDAACPEGYVCLDDPDDDCNGGPAVDCPGNCEPIAPDDCSTDEDCPVIDAGCDVCADGSLSCPMFRCEAGSCLLESEPCVQVQSCGGIAGLSCEPGFTCVDDPTDECVPDRGDADCDGICRPLPPPRDCFAGFECPPGFACVDAPDDTCDREQSGEECPGVCEIVPGDECANDDDCPDLRAACTPCADGTEACPYSFCARGYCNTSFPVCMPPGGCAADSDCAPGEICRHEPDDACDPTTGLGCFAICVPEDPRRPCGGVAGDTCPRAYECADDPDDECDPEEGGADCPGHCVPIQVTECATDRDCATIQSCQPCPDGSSSCPNAECVDGKCLLRFDPCFDPGFCGGFGGFPCPPGLTCIDDDSDDCDPENGGADCPGVCVPESPTECRDDGDCFGIQACHTCPDGTFACPQSVCLNGTCGALESQCRDAEFCGGVAGFPCPPGFTCIDDAGDDCDPNNGGADCAGVCVREQGPIPCGGFAGETCPEGYACVDAEDDCDPTVGADCGGFCLPVPGDECHTDEDCPAVGAPCQMCADGSAACPESRCEDGGCRVDFHSCRE